MGTPAPRGGRPSRAGQLLPPPLGTLPTGDRRVCFVAGGAAWGPGGAALRRGKGAEEGRPRVRGGLPCFPCRGGK